ncbi:ABC transporter substrate-binding protein [Arthrobacter sunyaminii]|uniref:ABC transporter substrate-binding protein n=1 Tax=Arthrobacter sunyaminii TaxID=2816859 RepID=A0A975S6A3_9MICC|nr:ABC transporter substrate-binding protein [Arthrobacter sunyaminii]MBO0909811.1 ABC transporter substrate-binding protein [Arthrobacter sunyaminii]QWQ36601.1 ABC transporter substrate-binding protein [Arthrobacter sunyaminii]
MISKRLSAALVVALLLTGCGDGNSGSDSSGVAGPAGDPVDGGTLRVLEVAQPTGFDPVQAFSSTSMPLTFTALYGQFVITNPETGAYECGLCESFTTPDGGATWDVVTREGMTFTDGTPFDAAALKYNWDRVKDPAMGSASAGMASQIADIEVVDPRTARLHMTVPTPGFLGLMPIYALQWIASPTALEAGQEAFNKNPVGAGPFLFESWSPGGVLKLKKNENSVGEQAHLDTIEIQGVADNTQRLNALIAGQADIILNSDETTFIDAEAAGFTNHIYTFNGGVGFMVNTAKEPFNDVRARQALSYAIDMKQIAAAVNRGNGTPPETLFQEESPFYSDIPLHTYNPEKAQALFDELADEGKPVDFTYTVFPGTGSVTFDALQAQIAEYENVTITADQRDTSEQGVVTTSGDYQLATSSLAFVDPASRLWGALNGEAERTNYSRINDAELNAALDAALVATDPAEEKKHYETVQQRLVETSPYLLYQKFLNGAISNDKVQGVTMFGYTTPAAGDIWLQQ